MGRLTSAFCLRATNRKQLAQVLVADSCRIQKKAVKLPPFEVTVGLLLFLVPTARRRTVTEAARRCPERVREICGSVKLALCTLRRLPILSSRQ